MTAYLRDECMKMIANLNTPAPGEIPMTPLEALQAPAAAAHVPEPFEIVVEECDRCWKPATCVAFGDETTRLCLECLKLAVAALEAPR